MTQRNLSLNGRAGAAADVRRDEVAYESAETAVAREQAEADGRTPPWDLASRITTARGALARGVPAEIVRSIYGDAVFSAATAADAGREVAHAAR